MPVGSKPQGVYFDLGKVRRVAHALDSAFSDAGAQCKLSVGEMDKSKESLVLYATDGSSTHALWCDDETIFDGSQNPQVAPIPSTFFGQGVFGNEAFFKDTGMTCRLSVDKTINNKLGNRVTLEVPYQKHISVSIPKGTPPSTVVYSAKYTTKQEIVAFMSGLGMLYGFGKEPGFIIRPDRLEGITVGSMPGDFEIKTTPTVCTKPGVFYKIPRAFCYVALNMFFAAGIHESADEIYLGIFDESSQGLDTYLFMRCGKCGVYCTITEEKTPSWMDYVPIAFINQVKLNQPSVFLMLSALASLACAENVKTTTLVYDEKIQRLKAALPNGADVSCEIELDGLPPFRVDLSTSQIVALSNTIGAAGEDASVEFLLGDDDEIIVSIGASDTWMIRLK